MTVHRPQNCINPKGEQKDKTKTYILNDYGALFAASSLLANF